MKDARLYVPVDVGLPSNRKFLGLDTRPKWLALTGLCWAKQNLNDGVIDPKIVAALAGVPPRFVQVLVDRDVWHEKGHACLKCPQPEHDSQVIIHDWNEHNRSAERVRRVQDAKRRASRLGNHERWHHTGSLEECDRCN